LVLFFVFVFVLFFTNETEFHCKPRGLVGTTKTTNRGQKAKETALIGEGLKTVQAFLTVQWMVVKWNIDFGEMDS